MAQDFERSIARNVGTSAVTIMTSNSDDTVVGLNIANTTTSQVTATVTIESDTSNRSGSNDEANQNVELVTNAPIPSGASLELLAGNKVIMETTDVLKLTATGATDIALSIMEIT